jgi:hypothetical protein
MELEAPPYAPDVHHPDGHRHLYAFSATPWPTCTFRFPDASELTQELFVRHDAPWVVVRWQLTAADDRPATLEVRPLLSGRDYHSLHHEDSAFRRHAEVDGERLEHEVLAEGTPPGTTRTTPVGANAPSVGAEPRALLHPRGQAL